MAACVNCGNSLADGAKFCGQCGTVQTAPVPIAAPAPPPKPLAAMTMIGVPNPMAAMRAASQASPPQQQSQPLPPQNPDPPAQNPSPATPAFAAKTMLGFMPPEGMIPPAASQPAPTQPMSASSPAAVAPPKPAPNFAAKTMLGVAIPGIAPLQASAPAPQSPIANKTMLGVAVPGIAPIHDPAQRNAPMGTMMGVAAPGIAPQYNAQPYTYEPPPPVVPAPAPLVHEALPDAPVFAPKKGVPIAIVAAIAGGLLVVGAIVIAVLVRGSAPLTASPKLSAENKEQLHLICEGCADGTTASLDGIKTTFAKHEADLDLAKPLKLGDNTFVIALDRPSMGRDEQVKLTVSVAYRIRADLSQINATPPAIQILVEALTTDKVELDGKPFPLDASGKGTNVIDLTSEVTGEGDAKTIERKLAYSVIDKKGAKTAGEVSARVGVLPLHIDAPGLHATTDATTINVAGRTAKGGQISINGALAPVSEDGTFGAKVPLPDGASVDLVLRAQSKTGDSVARIVTIPVKRVHDLRAEASSFEKTTTLGFDALTADTSGNVGKPIVVEGSVLEARAQNHGTVMVVHDRRGCAHGSSNKQDANACVVRVLYGGDVAVAAGDNVRAYGIVQGDFASKDGSHVPEVSADFLLKGN